MDDRNASDDHPRPDQRPHRPTGVRLPGPQSSPTDSPQVNK